MKTLKILNFIRIVKEEYFLYELIGMNRRMVINTYENIRAKSQIKWDFYSPVNENISRGQSTA